MVVDIGELLCIALGCVIDDDIPDQRKQLHIERERVMSTADVQAATHEIARRKAAVVDAALHRQCRTAAGAADDQLQFAIAAVRADLGCAGLGRIRGAGLQHFQ